MEAEGIGSGPPGIDPRPALDRWRRRPWAQAPGLHQRTPKKMKRLALRSALSARASEEAVMVIEDFDWSAPKTKQAVTLLEAMGAGGKSLVVLAARRRSRPIVPQPPSCPHAASRAPRPL